MISTVGHDLPTLVTGFAAIACLTGAPLCKARHAVISVQFCASLCFVAHYLCLGFSVAAAMNVLGAVQTLVAIFAGRGTGVTRFGYALILLMVLSGLWFWQSPISGISMIAMVLIAIGRMQVDQIHMRLLILAGGIAWIAHDFLASAWLALIADIGAFATGLAALLALFVRIRIEWRFPSRIPSTHSA